MKPNYDPKKLAQYEIGWWRAHHRKNWLAVRKNMAKEYQAVYGLLQKIAFDIVDLRLKAILEHDLAEKLEDEGRQEEADKHWSVAEDLLVRHFTFLKTVREAPAER